MAAGRQSPPEAVNRTLRQEAGFGCCVCGLPIYQYHHIVPWSEEKHFRVEDMMLLCPLHHDAATKGALTVEQQREGKLHPHNRETGIAEGVLTVNQPYLAIAVGGVLLVGEGPLIAVDGEPLLATTPSPDGVIQLSASLYDEQDSLVAAISENEWISGDPLPWDIESDHQRLRIRSALYKVDLDLDAGKEPIRLRGELWRRGNRFSLRPSGVRIHGGLASRSGFEDVALVRVGLDIKSAGELVIYPLGEKGFFVSESDPTRRLVVALQRLHENPAPFISGRRTVPFELPPEASRPLRRP
jgi:hypothetical protein